MSRKHLRHFSVYRKNEKLSFFHYEDIWEPIGEGAAQKIHYPIYLVMQSQAIDFYYHGVDPWTDSDQNSDQENHIHQRILHLPLTAGLGDRDNLTAVLSRIAVERWGPKRADIGALSVVDPYGDSALERWGQKGAGMGALSVADPYGYSALELWESQSDGRKKNALRHDGIISLGRLFLDFIFDLEHAAIFRISPFKQEAEEKLFQSSLANAIHDKAEFYWQRRLYVESAKSDWKSCHVQLLENAEREWMQICLSDNLPEDLTVGRNWFRPVEEEMRNICFPADVTMGGATCWDRIQEYHQERARRLCSESVDYVKKTRVIGTWFLKCYDLDAALLSLFMGIRCYWENGRLPKDKEFHKPFAASTSGTVPCTLSPKACEENGREGDRVKESGLMMRPNTTSIFLFVTLIWLLAVTVSGMSFASPVFPPYLLLLLELCAIVGLIGWPFVKKKDSQSEAKFGLPKRPLARILLIAYIALFGTLMLFDMGCMGEKLFLHVLALSLSCKYGLLVIVGLLGLVFLYKFAGGKFRKKRSDSEPFSRFLMLVSRLFLPRLLFAITASWFIILTTEEIIKSSLLAAWPSMFVGLALLLVSFFFTALEINNSINRPLMAFRRALELLGVAYLMSITVGFVAMNFVMKPYVINSGYLESKAYLGKLIERDDSFKGIHEMVTEITNTNHRHVGLYRINSNVAAGVGTETAGDMLLDIEHWPASLAQIHMAMLEHCSWGVKGTSFGRPDDNFKGIRYLYYLRNDIWGHHWFLMPGFLLYRACFAVFIGLFLQLIFEDKRITEPL